MHIKVVPISRWDGHTGLEFFFKLAEEGSNVLKQYYSQQKMYH